MFSTKHLMFTRPALYRNPKQDIFKNNNGRLRPNLDPLTGVWGPLQNKDWTKQTVISASDYWL